MKFFKVIGDFFVNIRNWIVAFFAVDNTVNEDTVFAVILFGVFIWLLVQATAGNPFVTNEIVFGTLAASLAALGIGGFKKP